MTELPLLTDENAVPRKMRSSWRCDKGTLVLTLVAVIVFQCYMYYRAQEKWERLTEHMGPLLTDSRTIILQQQSLSRKIEDIFGRKKLNDRNRPTIYAITPTFTRPVQKAELTRLAQTFMLVPNFHWIIVEDSQKKTTLVMNVLNDSGLPHTHLNVLTPPNYKLGKNDPNWKKPRGVEQRNAALKWIRDNLDKDHKGVVFFADDDNTYSVKLFDEMAKINNVGVWPVGLVGGLMVEKPICDKATNKVVGFNAVWKPDRPFPVDMAGFAINLKLILEHQDAWFSFEVQSGYQESEILRQIVSKDQLEPLADFCTKVYVWHTRTEPPQLNAEQLLIKKGKKSNNNIEMIQ